MQAFIVNRFEPVRNSVSWFVGWRLTIVKRGLPPIRRTRGSHLRKMETSLSLLDSCVQPLLQDPNVAVIGHLEVVDARHDRRQELVGSVGRFGGFADDGEEWGERFEACERVKLVSCTEPSAAACWKGRM